MVGMIMIATALAASPAEAGSCERVHIFADGRVERNIVPDRGQGAASTDSSASGSGRASSHVSVSSSSSAGGSSSRSSASSMSDGKASSMTVTRGPDGCRIVIDERADRSNR